MLKMEFLSRNIPAIALHHMGLIFDPHVTNIHNPFKICVIRGNYIISLITDQINDHREVVAIAVNKRIIGKCPMGISFISSLLFNQKIPVKYFRFPEPET